MSSCRSPVAVLAQASLAPPLAGAYHSGFNAGYNCAESTNFATPTWIEIGAIARTCDCRDDCVRIDLRLFLDVSWVCSRSHIYAADQCAGNVLACLLPAGGV